MSYKIKPLSCDPTKIKGMSERLIMSHYENNYGGAVKRLNLIEEQLADLDYAKAAGFVINGLKREQLVAMNSMIRRRIGLGAPVMVSARSQTRQSMGIRSLPYACGRHTDPRARYVRAFLSPRFWRQGCELRRDRATPSSCPQ